MNTQRGHAGSAFLGLALSALLAAWATSDAAAQEGFSNASLRGTYTVSFIGAGPDEPSPNWANMTVNYFDGEGNHRLVFLITNRSGEPDDDGNPTRNLLRTLSDPTTWRHNSGTYEMFPFGAFLFETITPATLDGLVRGTEMIDGVPVIVDFTLVGRNVAPPTGGAQVWRGRRIADGDILPPAPE